MIQLFPILIVMIVLAADGGLQAGFAAEPDTAVGAVWSTAAIAWVPMVGLLGVVWLGVRRCEGRLHAGKTPRPIMAAERIVRYSRWLILAHYAVAVLLFGWLSAVRAAVGDLILADELITILPPLLGVLGTWWIYYPIERRLREAILIRQLDQGDPIYPIPTRGVYVLLQARLHLLLLLVPVLLILAAAEVIDRAVVAWAAPLWAPWLRSGGTLVAALTVFVFAPLLVRVVLAVEPLADGPVRDDLMAVCRRYGVRLRQALVWRTYGSMINAAVMGLVARLRYLLVTDALLQTMTRTQVNAVLAHEIGHLRWHHLPWLVICFMATMALVILGVEVPLTWFAGGMAWPMWLQVVVVASELVLALTIFGWVSRRFERQADTFAVQHLSSEDCSNDVGGHVGGPSRITPEAVGAMRSALAAIAHLNTVDRNRPSWRHGSIAWRQSYLDSIVGRPVDRLPIDVLIRRLKALALLGLMVAAASLVVLELRSVS